MHEIFTRQEGEFWKMLAKQLRKMGELLDGQEEAIKELKEIIALIDGYFLTSCERVRRKDIQISLIKEASKPKGEIDGHN